MEFITLIAGGSRGIGRAGDNGLLRTKPLTSLGILSTWRAGNKAFLLPSQGSYTQMLRVIMGFAVIWRKNYAAVGLAAE
ncbi:MULTISPECIES: hypothetical protein [Pectobacterium]|uniref:Uncharacterized protein n=1 Tax=Pectobacterium carotovorum subsp. carotovorum (strain PC1) TaxID=561230 RepID=C6DDI7_PECCP|nr:hypothetical protein [Pectobacterium carotovorum]ACT14394.1 hypothetical protein PC1_3378 [Pectobacterium carotovorum subsp. carotovorum PC1]